MKKVKFYSGVTVLICCALCLSGCASLTEKAKGFAGVSTKALEESRKDAVKETLPYDYLTTYGKVKSILKDKGSYIYNEDPSKNMIAIYVSELDTTPVGIFFTVIDANNTQVEVSSPSTSAKEIMSARIFYALPEGAKQQ